MKMRQDSRIHLSHKAAITFWLLMGALQSFAGARPMDRPLPPPQRSAMEDKRPPPPPPGRVAANNGTLPLRGAPPRPPPQQNDNNGEITTNKKEHELTFIIEKNIEKDRQEDRPKRPDPPGAEQKEQLLSQIRLHQPPPPRPPQPLHRPPLREEQTTYEQSQQRQGHQHHAVGGERPQQRQQPRPPQQQQHYQYARPLPPQQRGPPPRRQVPPNRSSSSGVGGGIKGLWQQVERGLDGLADLEDAVSDRAKSLLPWGRPKPPPLKALPPPPEKRQPPDTRTTERPLGKEAPPSVSDRKETLPTIGGSLLDRAANKHKVIGSNGGASVPSRTVEPLQAGTTQESQRPITESEHAGPYSRMPQPESHEQDKPFVSTGQRRASIYEGLPIKEKEKRPLPRSNPISELNAMPGQRFEDVATRPARRPLDDDERTSIFSKFAKFVPPLPRLPFSKLIGRGSSSYQMYADASMDVWRQDDEDERKKGGLFGLFRRKDPVPKVIVTTSKVSSSRDSLSNTMPPVANLLSRFKHGNSTCLLSEQDIRTGRSIGKSRAALDVACLAFILFGVREILPYVSNVPVPRSFADLENLVLPELRFALSQSFDSWAWFGFVAAFLASETNGLLYDQTIRSISSSVGTVVQRATEYGQLFLRLVAAVPVEKHVSDYLNVAAGSQFVGVVSAARLRYFVSIVLSVVVLMTVSIVRPIAVGILMAVLDLVTLPQLRHWPLQWGELATNVKNVILPLGDTVKNLIRDEIVSTLEHPLKLAFVCSVLLAMLTMSVLPRIEQRRPIGPPVDLDDEEDEASYSAFGNFDTVANLGTSSASRIDLYAKSGTIEGMLERWQAMRPEPFQMQNRRSMHSMFRLLAYGTVSLILAAFPLFLHNVLGMASTLVPPRLVQVDSLLDSSILLLFVLSLTWKTMGQLIGVSDTNPAAVSFLSSLDDIVGEVSRSQEPAHINLQQTASISPTKGLVITDLWAAHTAKRAWAVRGAHLQCRNGEVVVILGDDSAGKSRLLTTISEAIVAPPRRSLSTTKVRGSISFGGLDVTKWDRRQLKKRVGLVLNDVRTVSDTAELVSGLTLEEILEPLDGTQNPGEARMLNSDEKSAISLALQITGLSATLIPRLSSKLATVVTANEDELSPSPLRPRCNALSPAEWSKVLFARVLTQTILDNDNPAASGVSIERSLIGSLLLLDDVTVHMSEVEEANLIATLRKTGAASLVTSHKWATGRFADRIVVVKDGAIVENGSHSELLARGPRQSIYASKWHAMTTL